MNILIFGATSDVAQELATQYVKKGDEVKRGDVIGFVGDTGKSTSSHLHYEVYRDKKDVNPKDYILNYSKIPVWDKADFSSKY